MGVNKSYAAIGTEFTRPPAEPIGLLRQWFHSAVRGGVREPGALALATVAEDGRPSSRMIQTIRITEDGLVFASHADSPKARDIDATGWGSGVLYWRETNQQVSLSGRVERLPDADADAMWAARSVESHPMSVVSKQSAPLEDEESLRDEVYRLAAAGAPLPRPASWVGYQLTPSTVEFWQSSPDRLYRRLRYDLVDGYWNSIRLQP